jgi:hypothetical protein
MTRYLAGTAAVLALALACGAWAQDAPKESSYYPLKKGTTWTYKVGGTPTSITMQVTGYGKDGAKVETLVDGKSVAAEHVLVKDDGIYRTTFMGIKPDAPVRFLKLPAKKGEKWTVDTKVQDQPIKGTFITEEDEVTVPAGKFKALKAEAKDFSAAGMKMAVSYWFAEKVGIVKLSFSLAGRDTVLELEKFEEGK